jgi:hypothetical protein
MKRIFLLLLAAFLLLAIPTQAQTTLVGAPQGPQGDPGPQGPAGQSYGLPTVWDSGTTYAAYDVVTYLGSSYAALAASTGVPPDSDGSKWALMAQKGDAGISGADGAPGVPGYSANSVTTTCWPVYVTGLTYRVPACSYIIGGTTYTTAQVDITLGDADPTNPRIDVIAANTSGAIVVVAGTPAANPVKPTVDPDTQIELTHADVEAGATTPTGVTSTLIYDENAGPGTEWTCSKNGAGINLESTTNPFSGTKDIEGTAVSAGQYVVCEAASAFNIDTLNTTILNIRSKATWPRQKSIQITLLLNGVQKGSAVVLNDGAFSFSSATISAYQQIVITNSLFAKGESINQIKFNVAGGGSAIGFYLDRISMQAGVAPPTAPSSLTPKGTWNSTATYSVNEVVDQGGVAYRALAANTNQQPPNTTYWAPISYGEVVLQLPIFDWTTDVATGDGKYYVYVDQKLNGMNLVRAHAQVVTAGTTNATTVQIARCAKVTGAGDVCSGTVADMLTSLISVDSGENNSTDSASPVDIDESNDDVATGQVLRVDVDAVSTTAPKGLIVTLAFRLP